MFVFLFNLLDLWKDCVVWHLELFDIESNLLSYKLCSDDTDDFSILSSGKSNQEYWQEKVKRIESEQI